MLHRVRNGLLAAVLAAIGCTPLRDPCFTPQSVITDLRVLGVRADPPEVLVDLDSGSVPSVDVRILVVDPNGPAKDAVVRAQLCVPDDAGCPAGTPEVAAATNASGEAHFVATPAAAMIRASRDADPLLGYGGIRVQLDATARSSVGASSGRKMLLYTPRTPGAIANGAMEISGVKLLYAGDLHAVAPSGGTILLATGIAFGVRPVLAPGSIEEYDTVTLDGRNVRLTEHVSYNFYATQHLIFGDPRSGGSAVGSGNLQGGEVADEPGPGDPEPFNGLVRVQGFRNAEQFLWVVGRDGRGAVAWANIRVNQAGQDLPEITCR